MGAVADHRRLGSGKCRQIIEGDPNGWHRAVACQERMSGTVEFGRYFHHIVSLRQEISATAIAKPSSRWLTEPGNTAKSQEDMGERRIARARNDASCVEGCTDP